MYDIEDDVLRTRLPHHLIFFSSSSLIFCSLFSARPWSLSHSWLTLGDLLGLTVRTTLSEWREYRIRMRKNAKETEWVWRRWKKTKLTVPPSWLRSIVVHCCMRKLLSFSQRACGFLTSLLNGSTINLVLTTCSRLEKRYKESVLFAGYCRASELIWLSNHYHLQCMPLCLT